MGAVELATRRAAGAPPPEPRSRHFEYSHVDVRRPFFARGRDGRYHSRRPGSRRESFAARKEAGSARVFVVGGSVAMPFAHESATRLEEFLVRALRGRRVEVVSMGMAGYDSDRERLLLAEALRHEPDLLVLMSGNNESHEPPLPRPWAYELNARLRRSALYRALQDRLAPRAEPPRITRAEREERFERNVAAMLTLARSRGVPAVVCTLPANLRDLPPSSARPPADAAYLDAERALDAGDLAAARSKLSALAESRPGDPFVHYTLARALDRLGLFSAARETYGRAADLDDPGERCSPRRNVALRRVARESGAAVADIEALFQGLVPDGLPDARLLMDGVHWYSALYPRVSLAIVRAAREAGALAPPTGWDLSWADELEKELPVAADAAERASRAPGVFLIAVSRALQARELDSVAVALFLLAERIMPGTLALLPSPAPTLALLQDNASPWAENLRHEIDSHWWAALINAGEACRRLGRKDAAAALRAAAARRGAPREVLP